MSPASQLFVCIESTFLNLKKCYSGYSIWQFQALEVNHQHCIPPFHSILYLQVGIPICSINSICMYIHATFALGFSVCWGILFFSNIIILLYHSFFFNIFIGVYCFTMACQFLLYNKENELYVYIYPHIPSLLCLPPTLPIPPLQVITKRWADLPVLCSCFPLANHFTFDSVYMSMLLSLKIFFPASPLKIFLKLLKI